MAYISSELRQRVLERAEARCEYCRFPLDASLLSFEMEHIIAEKHGGLSEVDNLALACPHCNRRKGSDLGSLDSETSILTPFFNPRTQNWTDHFQLDGAMIVPVSAEGRETVKILQLNHPERLLERERLIKANQYP